MTKHFRNSIRLGGFIYFACLIQSCYSFTAGAIPLHLKSIFVPMFIDQTEGSIPLLKETVTKLVIEKITTSTPLSVIQSPTAHAKLDGIISYFSDVPGTLDPVTQLANTNKIAITIKVTFYDNVKSKQIYSQDFSNTTEYPVNNLTARTEAISKVFTDVTQSIVDKMSSNW